MKSQSCTIMIQLILLNDQVRIQLNGKKWFCAIKMHLHGIYLFWSKDLLVQCINETGDEILPIRRKTLSNQSSQNLWGPTSEELTLPQYARRFKTWVFARRYPSVNLLMFNLEKIQMQISHLRQQSNLNQIKVKCYAKANSLYVYVIQL